LKLFNEKEFPAIADKDEMNRTIDISRVKDQPLSTLIANHCQCDACDIVDRDPNRAIIGYKCPRCGVKGTGGQTYFHIGILSTINIIQELYHTTTIKPSINSVNPHKLATVVFFCTLVEALLENLLREHMCAHKIPSDIQERLLADNLTSKQRVTKLFPTIFSDKWETAISKASQSNPQKKYKVALELFLKAVSARNRLLHPPGNKWAIGIDLPRQCIFHLPTLLDLFVWLHNNYIAKDKITRPTHS